MGPEIDDLMARFNSLNAGPYAVQQSVERERERRRLPPDELQDRLNQLRNPEKIERDLEEYEKKQRRYKNRFKQDYKNRISTEIDASKTSLVASTFLKLIEMSSQEVNEMVNKIGKNKS